MRVNYSFSQTSQRFLVTKTCKRNTIKVQRSNLKVIGLYNPSQYFVVVMKDDY